MPHGCWASPDTNQIETLPVSFACTCNLLRISRIVWDVFQGDEKEFSGNDQEVEARCPRCGRTYMITRDDFLDANRSAPIK